ncbi:MAG: outer rane efflux protein [Bacteroidetes bacterium]|nr:outer rane efflux protein [Bacteroidota bacterium]
MKKQIKTTFLFSLFAVLTINLYAQNSDAKTDSLDLGDVISKVISSYPSVKKAEIDIESSNAKIGLAKSGYYPLLDLTSSYSHLGPISQISLPDLGTFNLYPADNYNASLNLNQQLYDFGKTKKSVDMELQEKALSQLSLEQLKQRLSLSILGNYYSIVYLQEAIQIKEEELKNLNDHLLFVEKKVATGSATQYEILTTKVRISNIQNQETDLQTSLQVQQSQLNSFLGQSAATPVRLKKRISAPQLVAQQDVLLSKAVAQRDEMRIARQRNLIAESHMKVVDAEKNPVFNAFASGGFKNGYMPEQGTLKANYVVGIGFKFPILDGQKTKYNRMQVKNDLLEVDQDAELVRRNISNEVVECRANVDAALKKISQSELQLKQAEQAYALAQTSFKAGTITNLDLLDSSTSLAESHLSVTKSHIDYTVNLLKLKIAIGERIY